MRNWLNEIHARLVGEVADEDESNERRRREEIPYGGDDTFAHASMDVFTRVTASSDCEVIWKALERRSDPNARPGAELMYEGYAAGLLNEAVEGAGPDATPPTLGAYCLQLENSYGIASDTTYYNPSRYIGDMAYDLIAVLAEIRMEPVSAETSAKRRAKLREVEQSINKLRAAIAPLWDARRYRYSATDEFAVDQAEKWLRKLLGWGFVRLDAESVAIAFEVAKRVARNPDGLLDALVADAAEWADEKLDLARPNDPNAARLLFIRKLTAYFREAYGEPLRACVLAATGTFFDCASLDESAIAKLAP